ncbi:unnamed protein product [Cuscuta europaea]|uniref:Uncharacterized protein n=1 Tax=Cuscuta europaea TaxID=41803 RepID=A0A9P0Z6Z0_CUSEU|nr:unnamed protein product [Cuscuta europaea]
MASSLIVLISKRDNIFTFSDFRPISLSNFINKGRDISDHILVAQKILNSIDKKVRGTNIMGFLQAILSRFGFLDWFITVVMNHLKAIHFFVLINGSPKGFLPAT